MTEQEGHLAFWWPLAASGWSPREIRQVEFNTDTFKSSAFRFKNYLPKSGEGDRLPVAPTAPSWRLNVTLEAW